MENGTIRDHIWTTLVFLTFFSGLLGCCYPGVMTLILQTTFHTQANGSLIRTNNHVQGSWLLGQQFTQAHYFWGRPSALPTPYDASTSGGSNLSTGNSKQLNLINARLQKVRSNDSDPSLAVPIDLITASASGLDPHISIAAAHYQIPRIAKTRGIDEKVIYALVKSECPPFFMKLFVTPHVNVLKLNIALDKVSKSHYGDAKT